MYFALYAYWHFDSPFGLVVNYVCDICAVNRDIDKCERVFTHIFPFPHSMLYVPCDLFTFSFSSYLTHKRVIFYWYFCVVSLHRNNIWIDNKSNSLTYKATLPPLFPSFNFHLSVRSVCICLCSCLWMSFSWATFFRFSLQFSILLGVKMHTFLLLLLSCVIQYYRWCMRITQNRKQDFIS